MTPEEKKAEEAFGARLTDWGEPGALIFLGAFPLPDEPDAAAPQHLNVMGPDGGIHPDVKPTGS